MKLTRTIQLPIAGIEIKLYRNGAGSVTSDIEDVPEADAEKIEDLENEAGFLACKGALYTMLQSHAAAGIDVTTPAYLKGVQALVNELDDYR